MSKHVHVCIREKLTDSTRQQHSGRRRSQSYAFASLCKFFVAAAALCKVQHWCKCHATWRTRPVQYLLRWQGSGVTHHDDVHVNTIHLEPLDLVEIVGLGLCWSLTPATHVAPAERLRPGIDCSNRLVFTASHKQYWRTSRHMFSFYSQRLIHMYIDDSIYSPIWLADRNAMLSASDGFSTNCESSCAFQ